MSMFYMYKSFSILFGVFTIIACIANMIPYILYNNGIKRIKKKAKELNVDDKQLAIIINEYSINTESMIQPPTFPNGLIAVDIIMYFIMFMGMMSEL